MPQMYNWLGVQVTCYYPTLGVKVAIDIFCHTLYLLQSWSCKLNAVSTVKHKKTTTMHKPVVNEVNRKQVTIYYTLTYTLLSHAMQFSGSRPTLNHLY